MESTRGKETHTPDEIMTQKDFVIGKLKSDKTTFLYWRVRDFEDGTVDADGAREELQLTPMLPPKQVFIAGFPQAEQFAISQGFLNLIEKNQRGYFAVDMNVYTESYLRSQAVALDTEWGMRTQNHMSGGAVVDVHGYVVGLLVNGNASTAAVLSIENILKTFFTRRTNTGDRPAILLDPDLTPLFLKQPAAEKQNVDPPPTV